MYVCTFITGWSDAGACREVSWSHVPSGAHSCLYISPQHKVNTMNLQCFKWPLLCSYEFRVERALALCQKYEITDGVAYLLEKQGDFAAAYALIFSVRDVWFMNQPSIDLVLSARLEVMFSFYSGIQGPAAGHDASVPSIRNCDK